MVNQITVVIPTRNRADFAERAVQSVLTAAERTTVAVQVLVSDNSSESDQSARLESFCSGRAGSVVYVRPDSDLGMSAHWEWARLQAMATAASHVSYLTDRSLLKPQALAELARVGATAPNDVITFDSDDIQDRTSPVFLHQARSSGELLAVQASRLLYLSAQQIVVKPLPRMLNTLVPVELFDRLGGKYGSVFDSLAPDFCFCFRALASVDRILFLDEPLFTMYGTARSNGATTHTGVMTKDSRDFLRRATQEGGIQAGTSLPPVSTNYSVIAGEYVRTAAGPPGAVLPAVNEVALLRSLTLQTESFVPGELREANVAVLTDAGVRFGRGPHLRRLIAQAWHYLRVLGWLDFVVQLSNRLLLERPVGFPDTNTAVCWAIDHPRRTRAKARSLALRYLRGTSL